MPRKSVARYSDPKRTAAARIRTGEASWLYMFKLKSGALGLQVHGHNGYEGAMIHVPPEQAHTLAKWIEEHV